jgi:hypothetical protein
VIESVITIRILSERHNGHIDSGIVMAFHRGVLTALHSAGIEKSLSLPSFLLSSSFVSSVCHFSLFFFHRAPRRNRKEMPSENEENKKEKDYRRVAEREIKRHAEKDILTELVVRSTRPPLCFSV